MARIKAREERAWRVPCCSCKKQSTLLMTAERVVVPAVPAADPEPQQVGLARFPLPTGLDGRAEAGAEVTLPGG